MTVTSCQLLHRAPGVTTSALVLRCAIEFGHDLFTSTPGQGLQLVGAEGINCVLISTVIVFILPPFMLPFAIVGNSSFLFFFLDHFFFCSFRVTVAMYGLPASLRSESSSPSSNCCTLSWIIYRGMDKTWMLTVSAGWVLWRINLWCMIVDLKGIEIASVGFAQNAAATVTTEERARCSARASRRTCFMSEATKSSKALDRFQFSVPSSVSGRPYQTSISKAFRVSCPYNQHYFIENWGIRGK